MTITRLAYSVANVVVAEATPAPRHIWIDQPRAIYVFTGTDMPESLNANDITLNRVGLLQGALITNGQTMLNAVEAYIVDRITNGTPAQRIYWRDSQEFRRQHQYINQLRLAISASATDMNNVFINGSAYSPPRL